MFLQKLRYKLQEEAINFNNGNVISQKSNSILLNMRLDYKCPFILALSFTSLTVLVMKCKIVRDQMIYYSFNVNSRTKINHLKIFFYVLKYCHLHIIMSLF